MQITEHSVVTFEYTLTGDDGQVLDSSEGGDPLAYIHGLGNIIPGLEAALEGRAAGDAFKVSIPPDQAYGEREEDQLHVVPREAFDDPQALEIGMRVRASDEHGTHVLTVVGVEEDKVTLDSNHPLAGMTLHFDVLVVGVRPATADELDHGHAHGEGGHGH